MATKVIMPKLGLTMQRGTVVSWFRADGERVRRGEALFELETDKAVMQVDAPEDGVLRIVASPGTAVPVGDTVGWIAASTDEPVGDGAAAVDATAAPPSTAGDARQSSPTEVSPQRGRGEGERTKASPVARKLAEEAGLDLAEVAATGPGGRITKEDVERTLALRQEAPAPAVEPSSVAPARPVPEAVSAAQPSQPWFHDPAAIAPVTLMASVEAGTFLAVLAALCAVDANLEAIDLCAVIAARALRASPSMNVRFRNGAIECLSDVNIALEVDGDGGGSRTALIRDADRLTARGVARQRLAPDAADASVDGSAAALALSHLGAHGADSYTPWLRAPHLAALGVGRVGMDGTGRGMPALMLSLTFDHRLVDGATAARFLAQVARLVADPMLCLA